MRYIRHVGDVVVAPTDEAVARGHREIAALVGPGEKFFSTVTEREVRWPWRRERLRVLHVYVLERDASMPNYRRLLGDAP